MTKNKIYINIPNYNYTKIINKFFILKKEENPYIFNDNFIIDALCGCYSYSTWSINRKSQKYTEKKNIEKDLNFYWEHNLKVNYLFNNPFITENDLKDSFSNMILKCTIKNPGNIYIKSDLLYEYIKNNYPQYKLFKIAEPNEFGRKNILIENKYNNTNELKNIRNKNDAYVTLNPFCPANCEFYNSHKSYLAQEQSNYFKNSNFFICPLNTDTNFYDLKKHSNFITFEKMQDYIKEGFCHFRIDFPEMAFNIFVNYNIIDILESYIYYCIKQDYKNEIRLEAVNYIIKENEKRKNNE